MQQLFCSIPSMTNRMSEADLNAINAWLGDGWTPERRSKIIADYQDYHGQNPDREPNTNVDQLMLTAICELHDDVLEIPHADAVKAAVIVSVRYGGMSQSEAARRAGVQRGTVQRWLGK